MTFDEFATVLLQAAAAQAIWYGQYLYEVVREDARAGGAPDPDIQILDNGIETTLKRVGEIAGLPDMVRVRKTYGCHGQQCVSSAGQQVLVGFHGGDADKPYVLEYLPRGRPESVLLTANQAIQIGTIDADNPNLRVKVGSANHKGVARFGDSIFCGSLQITPGANAFTVLWTDADGVPHTLGVAAASGLVFTPDVTTGGRVDLIGKINGASTILFTQ